VIATGMNEKKFALGSILIAGSILIYLLMHNNAPWYYAFNTFGSDSGILFKPFGYAVHKSYIKILNLHKKSIVCQFRKVIAYRF
jgi:hypothetical protein